MNKQASVLFKLISSSISGDSLALQANFAQRSFHQRLIYFLLSRSLCSTEDFELLGRQLANIARHAYFAKQVEALDQASQIMLALPISAQLRSVAQHYQALCEKQKGDFESARKLLERVIEKAPPQYKARALQAIGATYHEQGKIEDALPFYAAAGKAAINCDPLTLAGSQGMIAVVRSIHGDHKQALDDLERLFPLVQAIGKQYPAFYYEYLNSLAVELGEVGRIDEAKAACAITLASPFSAVYQNWSETRDELEAKRTSATPSVVAVSAAPASAPLPKPARNLKPAPALAIVCLKRNIFFIQISIAITITVITRNILDRMRYCLHPRGPPVRF